MGSDPSAATVRSRLTRLARVVGVASAATLLVASSALARPPSSTVHAPASDRDARGAGPAGGAVVIFDEVLSGYRSPVYVTSGASAKRLFVVEQRGKIKVATRSSVDAPWEKAGVFLNVTGLTDLNGEQGLLGLAFHPDYDVNRRFYIFYTRASDGRLMVDEFQRATGLRADPGSRRNVLSIGHAARPNHNGGWLGFGPDGMLYISTGDGGGIRDPGDNAEDITSRLGKILRVDPLDPDGSGPATYSIPSDNPFVGVEGSDMVWSYGLRNPWRASFDRLTGDLWIGDVGQDLWEEVNRHAAPAAGRGANDGWDLCEGDHPLEGGANDCGEEPTSTHRPEIEYSSQNGSGNCAVTGGYVYRGADSLSLQGDYIFGDFCSGRVWLVPSDFDQTEGDTLPDPITLDLNVSAFGEDARGELYLVAFDGRIFHIEEAPLQP